VQDRRSGHRILAVYYQSRSLASYLNLMIFTVLAF
jgi:hypothetical protein